MTFKSKPASGADAPPPETEPPALRKAQPRSFMAPPPREPEPPIDPALASFFDDIEAIYRKHGLSLAHQDFQGAFIVEPLLQENIDWLRGASDERKAPQ